MDTVKPWYRSRTIWASIVTVVAGLGAAFGLNFGEAQQAEATEAILQAVTAVCGLLAIIGRVVAKSRIG